MPGKQEGLEIFFFVGKKMLWGGAGSYRLESRRVRVE
jgi:hypothetical protein